MTKPKSPCIDICRFDPATGWCEGCGRTREEAAGWRKLKRFHRGAIERDLDRRLQRLGFGSSEKPARFR
jgi:predicted Fe-S protein YdhL (DUF1289 family)